MKHLGNENSVIERSVISIICEDVDEAEIQQIETLTVTRTRSNESAELRKKKQAESVPDSDGDNSKLSIENINLPKDNSAGEVSPEENDEASSKPDDEEEEVSVSCPNEDEDGYDTDLEVDEKEKQSYKRVTAKDLYKRACEQMGVVPATYFLEHMTDESMNLSHHGLGPNGAKALAAPLVVNTTVLELNLEDNWITAEGIKDITDMLVENCYITNVNLAGNKLGKRGALQMSALIKENTNLRQLDLSKNDFSDNDGQCFADALKMNLRLKDLNLSGNSFCEIGGEWMGQAIANNEAIENLNLSWNHLRRKGALAICAGLKSNITIKYLDLSWNGFADDGAMAMGFALKTNSTLIWLDLSHNRISDKGAAMLAKGLEINDTLKTLKVANNPIRNFGAMALIHAISKNINSAIEELDVMGVQVNEDFLRESENLRDRSQDANSSRTNFSIMINASDVSAQNRKKYSDLIASAEPMDVIQKFLQDKRLRLIDLFRSFDKDLSWRITPAEFQKGILNAGVPLTKPQLRRLMRSLDIDKDGQVNYREFFVGKQKALLRRREMLRKKTEEKSKQKKIGKRTWGAWENALRITSSSSETNQATGKPTLRSQSLVMSGNRGSRRKESEKAGKQTRKTIVVPISSRLTKSFIGSSYPREQKSVQNKLNDTPRSSVISTSITSLEKLNLDGVESNSCGDVTIQVPASGDLRYEDGKRSILSVDSSYTPRRTGGMANSRKRPPSS